MDNKQQVPPNLQKQQSSNGGTEAIDDLLDVNQKSNNLSES